MGKRNPCDVCDSSRNCEGCVLNRAWKGRHECANHDCFCHYDCGCLLSFDDICKASTCYRGEAAGDGGEV